MEKDLDNKFINLAYKQAIKALNFDEVPVGCVLVLNDKVIARAYNKREHTQNALAHCEILAINKACKKLSSWRLNEVTLYVTLEPCPMCTGAIFQSRIKRIVYCAKDKKCGAIEGKISFFETPGLNHYPVIDYIEKKECSEILSNYFKNKRKRHTN